MKLKKTIGILLACVMSMSLLACASEEGESSSKGAVALSFGGLNVPIWNDIISFAKPELKEAGYELLVDDPQWDVQKQVSDWDAWRARGDLKAMMAFPVQQDAVVGATQQMVNDGIPVLGFSSKWDGVTAGLLTDAHGDGVETGRQAGEWIEKRFGDKPVTLALLSDRASDLGIQRADGIIEGLKETAPKAKVDELPGATREEGQANTERQLVAEPDTVAWLSTSEENLLATYQVLMDRGVSPTDPNVLLGTMDLTNESIDIIQAGQGKSIMRLAYVFPAEEIADHVVRMLIDSAEGKKVADQTMKPKRVTIDNAEDYRVETTK